jgi:hypothetical protein
MIIADMAINLKLELTLYFQFKNTQHLTTILLVAIRTKFIGEKRGFERLKTGSGSTKRASERP